MKRTVIKHTLWSASLLLLIHAHSVQASILLPEIDQVSATGVITFKNSPESTPVKPLHTGLLDLKVLRIFSQEPLQILVSGRPCENCLQEKAIYFFKISGGKTAQFVYPGRVLDPKTRATLLDSRAFFGRCLGNSKEEVYIVFQREKVDRRGGLPSSVLVASPRADGVVQEKLFERNLPKLNTTLKLSKSKHALCHEIETRNRIMLTKIPNFMAAESDEDKEAEDTVKESITQEEFPSDQD